MFTHDRTMIFVDGENLVMRYQDSIAAGASATAKVIHVQDALLWFGLVL
jgi:hypothetical protein